MTSYKFGGRLYKELRKTNFYNDLESAKGKSYVDDFIRKLTNEYKQSEYVLSKEEQKKLGKNTSPGEGEREL